MLVVVSYDVSTLSKEGRRRLRRVARACTDFGQRVQKSVFECIVDPEQWTRLKHRLIGEMKSEEDSLRFYFLGSNFKRRIEHHGINEPVELDGPLVL
jgi:CRISPR-associated protein Cas2